MVGSSMDKRVETTADLSLDELEDRALRAAVAEARADPRPDIPHDVVEREAEQERTKLLNRIATLPKG